MHSKETSVEKRLDGNYTGMLCAILKDPWKRNPTKQQLYGHQPPITQTIQIRRTRHADHCRRNKDALISDVLLRNPKHGHTSVGRTTMTYIHWLCADTGCSQDDQLWVMDDRDETRNRLKRIHAISTTWWWWWWWWCDRLIGLVGRVFANGPGELGSIPGRVIPKTLQMALDTSLLIHSAI